MLGVHPRLNQLLVTHLKELNAESLTYSKGNVVIQEEQQHADALLRLVLFDGDLALEMLALSSARCRQGNELTMLLLDSIQALTEGNSQQLQKCINQLQKEAGGYQAAAKQLARINSRLGPSDGNAPSSSCTSGPDVQHS